MYIHPTNIAAYTGCVGCEAITGTDLYFPTSSAGNLTYKTAWEKLMRNIARIYTTGTNIDAEVVTSNAGNFIYRWKVKHVPSPAGYWMGFDRNFPYLQLSGFADNIPSNPFQFSSTLGYLDRTVILDTGCGELQIKATSAGGAGVPFSNASNFNNIILTNSGYLHTPITTSILSGDISCVTKIATATINVVGNIASLRWENSNNDVLGTTNVLTVFVNDVDTYTLFVTLENGCVITKTVTF